MTQTTIRQIQGDEMLEIMYRLPSYAFGPSPPLQDKEESQEILKQLQGVTYFALFEDDQPVACVVGSQMTQHVRGALYGMGGIWGVVTHPAARRKGYSRRLMARLLASIRQEGRPLSCLYPFRESFYQRLGYVTFPLPRKAIFTPSSLLPTLELDLGGQVEMQLIGDGFDAYLDYTRQLLGRVHGMALFDHPDRASAQRNKFWLLLAKVEGQVVGLMVYDLKGEKVTEFDLRAIHFCYHDVRGRYLLLAWLARHVDQVKRVEIWLPPFEQPETWLADLQVRGETLVRAPMGRVLDVGGISGLQTGPGRFSASISDPCCPWNQGIWRFETQDGVLKVGPAESADCDLSIQALSALVYGTHDPGDFAIRGWGNLSPQVQDIMRVMFPPRQPFLHELY